jgi:hypothetical protein
MSDCLLFAACSRRLAVLAATPRAARAARSCSICLTCAVETLLLLLSSFTFGMAMLGHAQAQLHQGAAVAGYSSRAVRPGLHRHGNQRVRDLIEEGNGPGRSAFLSAFFSLVGTHGMHVSCRPAVAGVMMYQVWSKGVGLRRTARADVPEPVLALPWTSSGSACSPSSTCVFVTGGVVSSLGKGIASASLGRHSRGARLKVSMVKLDPYINVDPGTMSPFQHGEVFVTDDGAETDLDLGHYERFVRTTTGRNSNFTTGASTSGHRQGAPRRLPGRDRAGHSAHHRRDQASGIAWARVRCRAWSRSAARSATSNRCRSSRRSASWASSSAATSAVHAPDPGAVRQGGRRDQDQADAALGEGTARHRHPAGHPAVPLRAAAAGRAAPQDRAVHQRRGARGDQDIEAEGAQKMLGADAILVPGGFGKRGIEGKMLAPLRARNGIPYFGICYGMHAAVVEFARNVAGLKRCRFQRERSPYTHPVIALITEWTTATGEVEQRTERSTWWHHAPGCAGMPPQGRHAGAQLYGKDVVRERHRHRYEFNNRYRQPFEDLGMVIGQVDGRPAGGNRRIADAEASVVPRLPGASGIHLHAARWPSAVHRLRPRRTRIQGRARRREAGDEGSRSMKLCGFEVGPRPAASS